MRVGGGSGPFAVLIAMGVRVREVPDLIEGFFWMPVQFLLLIDRNLSASDRECLAGRLLVKAIEARSPQREPH